MPEHTEHVPDPVDLYAPQAVAEAAKNRARDLRSRDLTVRQLCDVELLLSGALAPLHGFMDEEDHAACLARGALADGSPWPWPLALDVDADFAGQTRIGEEIALRDAEGLLVALLEVSSVYEVEPEAVTGALFPGEARAPLGPDRFRLGGRLLGVDPLIHYDFAGLRLPRSELRQRMQRRGWGRVLAVFTGRPIGPGELALVERHAREHEASVLILSEGGMADPGDARYYARMRALTQLPAEVGDLQLEVALIPLPTRLGSAREHLLRAHIALNHGASHLLVLDGDLPATEPADAAAWLPTPLAASELVHLPERGLYCPPEEVPAGEQGQPCSNAELLERLARGERIPPWLGWPALVETLERAWPPRSAQGFTLFLTGLSGSGKSTIARALLGRLMEQASRRVTLLDGDIVRKNLSSELGFSREHRDLNIRRIGYVASEITKNGGVAICAPIAPYEATRSAVRQEIEAVGGFVEIHVATPLEVCEARDRKGLYAKARAGVIKEFTGISDPYEAPEDPEMRIDTTEASPDEAAQQILLKLTSLGYL